MTMMMMMMNLKMLGKNLMRIEVMMLLVVLALLVKWVDSILILQNDEISMQHNTSLVPNQAILMNTFPQHPKKIK